MNSKQNPPGKQLKRPGLPKQGFERGLPDKQVKNRAYYAQLILAQEQFAEQEAEHPTFDQILFQQVDLRKTVFKKIQVLDSRFTNCDLANATWTAASICRVEILGCHLTGFQSNEALFQDILFKECSASFVQFAFATFKSVRFEDCDLSESNFLNSDLTVHSSFIPAHSRRG